MSSHFLMPRVGALWLLLFVAPSLSAQSPGVPTAAERAAAPAVIPAPPKPAATAFVLEDFDSQRVLAGELVDDRVEPASITKIMTSYVVMQELHAGRIAMDDQVTVSENAWQTEGSRMFIEVNKTVSVENLLQGLIIQSGNDAAVALAEHVAGSEDAFAALMNEAAQRLGMHGSHFTNATGLPGEEHYTTPRDVVRMTRALIRDFPQQYAWYSQKEFSWGGITQHNRNTLLWKDPSVDGMKTGHTRSAGYCLVSTAKRGEMRLISVLMGSPSERARADDSHKLLNWGFRFHETVLLYPAGQVLASPKVWKGASEQTTVGLAEDLVLTIPRGRYDALAATMTIPRTLVAPIASGAAMGQVSVRIDSEVLAERPLVALEAVEDGGLWTRMRDGVLLWFESEEEAPQP